MILQLLIKKEKKKPTYWYCQTHKNESIRNLTCSLLCFFLPPNTEIMKWTICLNTVNGGNMEKQLNKTNPKVGSPLLASGSKKIELVPERKPWDSSCCIKNNNNNKQRNKNKHPHLHAGEQKSKKLPNIFCFVLLDYFYSLNLSSYIPLLPCFCMLETQYGGGGGGNKAWMLHLLSTGMFQITVKLEGTQML